MAKRRKLPTYNISHKPSKGLSGALGSIPGAGIPVQITTPLLDETNICIDLDETTVNLILTPSLPNPNSNPNPNLNLIGVQFELKDLSLSTPGIITHVIVSQVFMNTDNFSLTKNTIIDSFPRNDDTVQAIMPSGPDHLIELNDVDSNSEKLYEHFHSYSDATDLIYFGIEEFIYLNTFFKKIRLSGIETQLQSDTNSLAPGTKYSDTPYFSFKIEGVNPTDIIPSNVTSERFAGLFTGVTCPPVWYAAGKVLANNVGPLEINNEGKVRTFLSSWIAMNGYKLG